MSKVDAVRNKDGIWINSQVFREEGEHFKKYGYYCSDPQGSPAWYDYWQEQRRRCLKGYESGGVKISGDFYFYLNFCPIDKVLEVGVGNTAKKGTAFPDFWDGDYNYFWAREIARNGILSSSNVSIDEQRRILELDKKDRDQILLNYWNYYQLLLKPDPDSLLGGKDLILGKARRRGFSFKNASVGVNNYFHRPGSYTMYMAYEKKYLYPGKKTIFGKSLNYINFVNDNTAWSMPSDYIDKQDHIKSSYAEYKNGKKIEKGFKSEIEAISFKDNPDAGRGSDAYDIIGEEVGAWGTPGGLKATLAAMRSSSEAGSYKTGMITLFGTSGDIEGGTADFADLFDRPDANGFMAFYDIWGDTEEKKEGFFFPKHLNTEGFYDNQGNSDMKLAKKFELSVRDKLKKNGATSVEIQKRLQEEPLNSSEAFSIISTNSFPVVELKRQLDIVKARGLQDTKGMPVELYRKEGKVEAKVILNGKTEPITSYHNLPIDKRGSVVIYEQPLAGAPRGLYKIGYDPVRQDTGTSLAAIIVYKSVFKDSFSHSNIVAEYVGRQEMSDDIDRIAELLADYYNTTIMYENEVTGVKNYFRKIKRLNILAAQPDLVISKNIKSSKVSRVYGCHMNEQLKDAGERYVKDWLLTTLNFDENGTPITVIDQIYSRRLLEELIAYNRKGNFDLVSALFMCMFQVQEESLGKTYSEDKGNKKVKQLLNMRDKMYKKY